MALFKDFGKVMYTLLYLERITNKDQLYSTWNSAQCSVPAWMGGGFGEGWIHIYIYGTSLDGRRVWGRMDTCIYIYIWLSPFTVT